MGMIDNLCDSCTNIGCKFQSGIVRTECAFYMPPHLEPDSCGNFVVMQPTVYVIPKDQYENRLKADMVAMLTEIQKEIEERHREEEFMNDWSSGYNSCIVDVCDSIQQKINALKGEEE